MALIVFPLQAVAPDPDIEYSARDFRAFVDTLITEGVADVAGGDLLVSQRGAGANLTVDVAVGTAFVDGDDSAAQGSYHVESDAVANVGPFGAAPGSGARIDLVVLRVYDEQAGAPAGTSGPVIVAGVAAGSPSAPAVPDSAIPLAEVRLNAGDLSVQAANITDRRLSARVPLAVLGHNLAELGDVSDSAASAGQALMWNGTAWVPTTPAVTSLDTTVYNPGSLATYVIGVGAPADVDATNLTLVFTVPASGQVMVYMNAVVQNFGNITWALRNGAVTVTNSSLFMTQDTTLSGTRLHYQALVTGLTPGASVTLKWAAGSGGSAGNMFAGGAIGPAVMQVTAA